MYKQDLALSNLQWLICHRNKQNQTNQIFSGLNQDLVLKFRDGVSEQYSASRNNI